MNEQTGIRSGVLRVDVTGQTPALWQENRFKLIRAVGQVIDSITDGQNAAWFEKQAQEFTGALLDHAKAKLAKAGLENDKIEAEVARLYAEREKDLAEARKVHAEAKSQELDNSIKSLRLALGVNKAMLIGETGEEAILFGQQLDAMLESLKVLAES